MSSPIVNVRVSLYNIYLFKFPVCQYWVEVARAARDAKHSAYPICNIVPQFPRMFAVIIRHDWYMQSKYNSAHFSRDIG